MQLQDYLALPYTFVLKRDEDGAVIATVAELPGCMADGATEAEAVENLKDVQASWIRAALKAGTDIPTPREAAYDLPSGRWVQRAPKTLHARLVAAAQEEATSLNQLVVSLISEGLALRGAWRQRAPRHQKVADYHDQGRHEADLHHAVR